MKEGRHKLTTEDREEALLFIKGYDLTDEKNFTSFYIEDFIDSIDPQIVPDYDFVYGSTKLVIIPKDRDYVVKIPFNDNEKALVYYPDTDQENDRYGWDYCEVEQEIYQIAKEHNFEQFFLPIESLTDGYSPYPVYIQKKVEVLDETDRSQERYSSVESKKRVKVFRKLTKIDINWKAALLDALGSLSKLREFFHFLEKYGISDDLYNFNVGYCDGKPVILDYGGYNEDQEDQEDDWTV